MRQDDGEELSGGEAEVFMFLKQRKKEMKIPFCLSSSDRVGGGRKALKENKERKEKKIVFQLSDKATGIIIIYV